MFGRNIHILCRIHSILTGTMYLTMCLVFVSAVQCQTGPCLLPSNSNVTTWHSDNCRTGLQSYETQLSPSTVSQNSFGLAWSWPLPDVVVPGGSVPDQAYAQPLAVSGLSNVGTCQSNCNVIFVATEQDMVYAFQADSSSQTPLWGTNLNSTFGQGYEPIECANLTPSCVGKGIIAPYVGVTGTPVISTTNNVISNRLYVVSAVENTNVNPVVFYQYLHVLNVTNGHEITAPVQITGSFYGVSSASGYGSPMCSQPNTGNATIYFDPLHHIQRAGLLLVTVNNGGTMTDIIYVPFAPIITELQNGWIFGYTYTENNGVGTFAQVAQFPTTPYGTGGGVWESGAGLAAGTNTNNDASTYIYAPTGNGTFDANLQNAPNRDYGETMLKLQIGVPGINGNSLGSLNVSDFFTPSDYSNRCTNDLDFGSGGILLVPDSVVLNNPDVMISADKESYLWVFNRRSLGGVNGSGLVQQIQQPAPGGNDVPGYWSSPGYWKYLDSGGSPHYQIYYAPDETILGTNIRPYPISMYTLASTGLPTTGPVANTSDVFCAAPHAPTPIVSTSGTTSNAGIVWAVESSNSLNPSGCGPMDIESAVLHAYNATPNSSNILPSLYTSAGLDIGKAVNFPTPTVFNGRVYVGTKTQVAVFGPSSGK